MSADEAEEVSPQDEELIFDERNDQAFLGQVVDGRYQVLGPLGAGGMGTVYRGRDLGLERDVALKVISAELATNPAMVDRFRKEASALARVRSDQVVQVYAFGIHRHACFFAMELVRGLNLATIVYQHNEHRSLVPVRRALSILERIASGLADVHAAGIVHRDIKPANIIIESDTGRPVLVDFGLALRKGLEDDALKVTGGTPLYMAPEQAAADVPLRMMTPQTDIYALGCTAFELLTGRPPFPGTTVRSVLRSHRSDPVPTLSASRANFAPLDSVIGRALAKDPDDRYPAARTFASALARAAEHFREPERQPQRPLTKADAPAEAALRILVVEDDDAFRKFAQRAAQISLFRSKVEVAAASNGFDAIRMAAHAAPHLVLLDYELPGMNGIETLSRLRELPGGSSMRVMVMSANVGTLERWRFSVLGVADFVEKPVGFRELVETLAGIAERAGWVRETPNGGAS